MSNSREINTLRAMSWERAKGELNAYLQTFWVEYTHDNRKIDNGYELAKEKISNFINNFEDYCR